jgi:hypothetical protein
LTGWLTGGAGGAGGAGELTIAADKRCDNQIFRQEEPSRSLSASPVSA